MSPDESERSHAYRHRCQQEKTLVGWNLDILNMTSRVRTADEGVFIETDAPKEGLPVRKPGLRDRSPGAAEKPLIREARPFPGRPKKRRKSKKIPELSLLFAPGGSILIKRISERRASRVRNRNTKTGSPAPRFADPALFDRALQPEFDP